MFWKQVKHYEERFLEAKKVIARQNLEVILKSYGMRKEDFCGELEGNTELFRKIALSLAASVTKGKPACYSYAAAIAVIADELGYEYETYAGLCLNKNVPNYEKVVGDYSKQTFDENNLPAFASHFYIVIDGKEYEYYNGFGEVERFYVVKTDETILEK